tara:strand:- start:535 stop:702 length:168 start_codon:yes stop_codon:yes gene_type:complete
LQLAFLPHPILLPDIALLIGTGTLGENAWLCSKWAKELEVGWLFSKIKMLVQEKE